MSSLQPLQLSRLRDIGWTEWDPIGLLSKGGTWDHQPFADEYDRYLLEAAGRLRRDGNEGDVTEYLMHIEREHMGLGITPTSRLRAEATARAIQAYLETIEAPLS
jgi:hypothetical protein